MSEKCFHPFLLMLLVIISLYISAFAETSASAANDRPPTKARFDLIGRDWTYEDIGVYLDDESNLDMVAQHLTNSPKDILITFDRPVNHESVETSVDRCLKDKTEPRTFRWRDDQTLLFHIDEQNPYSPENPDSSYPDSYYVLSFKQARDSQNNPICGAMSFDVRKPSIISTVDLANRRVRRVKEFNDKIYASTPSPLVGRFVVLDDGNDKYSFDLKNRHLKPKKRSLYWGDHSFAWLDELHLLTVRDSRVVMNDFVKNTERTIFSGLNRDMALEAISISPNRQRIAVMQTPSLYVITVNGSLIYKSPKGIRPLQHDTMPSEMNLGWLDDNNLFYDAYANPDYDSDFESNVFKLDIAASRTITLVTGASKPVVSPNRSRMLYIKGTCCILFKGKETKLAPCRDHQCENFLFIDEDRLVFESDEGIMLVDLRNNHKAILTTGAIIGLSPDGRYLYTNSFKGDLVYRD